MKLQRWLDAFKSRCTARRRHVRPYRHGNSRRNPDVASFAEFLETRVLLAADFGDAPDTGAGTGAGNYETTAANGGPSHIIDTTQTTLFLGNSVDGDGGTNQSPRAELDDRFTSPNSDDEDGVLNPRDLWATAGTQPTVTLLVTNNTGSTATLSGWIDYDQDGVFENATERAQTTISTGTTDGRATLTFPSISHGISGDTYARFRLSTDGAADNSTGPAADGEVEDYLFTISEPADGVATSFVKLASDTNLPFSLDTFDQFGSGVANVGDLDGDGTSDLVVGAPEADAVFTLFMSSDGTVSSHVKISGPADEHFGASVASLGDIDGDGVSDIAVGAYNAGNARGRVFVINLNSNGTQKSSTSLASGMNGTPVLRTRAQINYRSVRFIAV